MFSRHRAKLTEALIFFSVNTARLKGCQEVAPPSSPELPRPVPILEIARTVSTSGLRFPGRVQGTQRAELAFSVPGRVVEFPAEEGETLPAGALIARLDPAVFETRLSAAWAELDKARVDYYRVREICEKSKAVARAELDQKRTAMVLAVVVMFNTLRPPLVIWLIAPLALIGVTIGLLLFKVPFEFMAVLGFPSLIGMLVKNSIVLVGEADSEIRAGKEHLTAVNDAAISRARPVFLGALTTILGLAPLLADPFFKSMAVTIIFALAFATVLTLVVVPLLYAALFRIPNYV